MRQETGDRRPQTRGVASSAVLFGLMSLVSCLWSSGCGYTTRPGLASHLKTIYVKPFVNKIDLTQLATNQQQFPIYRHGMEVDLTNAVINRYQFTGLLRPARAEKADCRLEGELLEFRRDALRYDASQQVEEWRLNIVVNLKFIDQTTNTVLWGEQGVTGDTTYFALGGNVERSVESW